METAVPRFVVHAIVIAALAKGHLPAIAALVRSTKEYNITCKWVLPQQPALLFARKDMLTHKLLLASHAITAALLVLTPPHFVHLAQDCIFKAVAVLALAVQDISLQVEMFAQSVANSVSPVLLQQANA
jgi:hypothetical protein